MSVEAPMVTKLGYDVVCGLCSRLANPTLRPPPVAGMAWLLEPFGKFWCARHIEELGLDILAAFDSGPVSGHELLVMLTALRLTRESAGVRSGHEFAESLSLALMKLAGEMRGAA